MQLINNNANSPDVLAGMDEIKLPPLSGADIDKLDYLISRMKEKQTEFVNIYSVCKGKWGGDNKLLYLFFAEYLKKNQLTTVQSSTPNSEYAWKHMIAPRGLAVGGFKYEYKKLQLEEKRKEAQESPVYQYVSSFLFAYCGQLLNYFCITIFFKEFFSLS